MKTAKHKLRDETGDMSSQNPKVPFQDKEEREIRVFIFIYLLGVIYLTG